MMRPGDSELNRRVRVRKLPGGEPLQQRAVQILGKIVAQLVGAVDAPLDVRQLGIGGSRRARFVLDVPQVEVGAMLAGNAIQPVIALARRMAAFGDWCQSCVQLVLQLGDFVGCKH